MTGQAPLSIAYVVITLCILPVSVDGILSQYVSTLKANLTKDYNKNNIPCKEYLTDCNISAYFTIDVIGNIDEKLEKLTTVIIIDLEWKDEFITWNATETGVHHLWFDKSELWVPGFVVYNPHYDTGSTKQDTVYLPAMVLYDGLVHFGQRLVAETSCTLDMTDFPFDRHTCNIQLLLNKYDVSVIPQFNKFKDVGSDGTWDVIDTSVAYDFDLIGLSITVARKPTFFLVNLISPMVILALLSPLVFLLPNSSGERIGFSVTILLALAVFMTMVADQVPQKSQTLPRLIYTVFISYSLSALVVIIVVINARIHDFTDCKHVPRFLVALVTCMRCSCYCFGRRIAPTIEELEDDMDTDKNRGLEELEEAKIADSSSKDAGVEVGYRKPQEFGAVTWHDVSWTIDMLAMTIIYLLKITLLAVTFGVISNEKD